MCNHVARMDRATDRSPIMTNMRLAAGAAAVLVAVELGAALWLHHSTAVAGEDCTPDQFSRELYCSGSAGQPCGQMMTCGKSAAGAAQRCYWDRQHGNASRGRWRPPSHLVRAHSTASARRCNSRQTLLFAGDSTTRDTFYHFLAALGAPQVAMHGFGRDVGGRCLGDVGSRCQRIVQMGTTTILFHFLRLTSGSHEADASDLGMMLSGRDQPDVVFLGCPFYETIFPNAYNYSRSRAQRQRANEAGTQRERWSAVQRTIGACAAFAARARAAKPRSRLFLLGPTPLADSHIKRIASTPPGVGGRSLGIPIEQ